MRRTIIAPSDAAITARNDNVPVAGPVRDGINRFDNSKQLVPPISTAATTADTAMKICMPVDWGGRSPAAANKAVGRADKKSAPSPTGEVKIPFSPYPRISE